jgi:hypothetical protein
MLCQILLSVSLDPLTEVWRLFPQLKAPGRMFIPVGTSHQSKDPGHPVKFALHHLSHPSVQASGRLTRRRTARL